MSQHHVCQCANLEHDPQQNWRRQLGPPGAIFGIAVRRSKRRDILCHPAVFAALSLSVGVGFVMAGYMKAFDMQGMTQCFTQSGYPPSFLKFTMTAEVFGGISLLIPWTVIPAITGPSVDMFGAIYTHVHNGDSTNDSTGAISALIRLAVIAVLRVLRPRRGESVASKRRRLASVVVVAASCAAAAMGGGTLMRLTVQAAAKPQASAQVFGNPDVWHWAPSRTYHVENYKLSLRFDQAKGEVFGDEMVTLRPFEPHFSKFYLNSAGLQIDSVDLERKPGAAVKLVYDPQDPRLWITLDRAYDATDTLLRVRIVYHAFPRAGLFFVNPTKDYPRWPREVYSQGDLEFNHYWFPCWDYPNDMATSETVTTVPVGQSVVSNGKLVKVTQVAGEATYDWVENVPHSSYLIPLPWGHGGR